MEVAKTGTRPYRLGAFVDGFGWVEHRYGRVWQREANRIVAAPDKDHVSVIQRLVREMDGPFRVDYFLLVPRSDEQDEGRFEMADALDHSGVDSFLRRYSSLFEDDGRHHLRIAGTDSTVIYDQHNVLYASGRLDRFASALGDSGLREGEVQFPSPHSHHYHEELDDLLEDMLDRYQWHWFPLETRAE